MRFHYPLLAALAVLFAVPAAPTLAQTALKMNISLAQNSH
jgi:hypothetical protein